MSDADDIFDTVLDFADSYEGGAGGRLFVLSDNPASYELPDAYADSLANILSLASEAVRGDQPTALALAVCEEQGQLIESGMPGARLWLHCVGADGSSRTATIEDGEVVEQPLEQAEALLGEAAIVALKAAFPSDEVKQQLDEAERERRRQLAALDDEQLSELLTSALLTLASRQRRDSPAELAGEIQAELFLDADSDQWALERWQDGRDAAPPEQPLAFLDAEIFLAAANGEELYRLIKDAVLETALRSESTPTAVLAGFATEHAVWQQGEDERLNELTATLWRSKQLDEVAERVAEHGYTYTYVMDALPFCYTTGLWQTYQHPELFLYGLSHPDAVGILRVLIDQIEQGVRLAPGIVPSELFNLPVALIEIPKDEMPARLNISSAFYGDLRFQALQVVISDRNGLLPWQPGCDPEVAKMQPLLGEKPPS